MTVRIDIDYQGELHCMAVHAPSGDRIVTDAPKDNHGRGEHFSPTDLASAAIGTCMLTIMGISARSHGLDLAGARASVEKTMGTVPRRHISELDVCFQLPAHLAEADRAMLEKAASTCPVSASLGSQTNLNVRFEYVSMGPDRSNSDPA